MQQLNEILRYYVQKNQLNPSELARLTGVGQPVIFRMLSGETQNPKVATLSPIAKHFGLSISQLIGDEPLPEDDALASVATQQTWRQIPHYTWDYLLTWPHEAPVEPHDYLILNTMVTGETFAVTVPHGALEPYFPAKTTLIIDPKAPAQVNDVILVRQENHITVKPVTHDDLHHPEKQDGFIGMLIETRLQLKTN